jgi:phosphate starvation-inducible PhoH-like protein
MGSREKTKISREINDGINEYQKNKIMKRSSLSRESFQNTTKSIVLTDKQNELYKSIRNNILTVVHGPAGTSKTFTSCYTALSLLADKKIEQIIITKPNVESGPSLGLLPGTIEEKIDPYKQSYYTNFCKILDKQTVDFLFSTEEIKFEPLSYMRGSTYDNCFMMLDECQNSNISQLMLWSTRLGKNSKAIMMGDTSQYDVKKKDSGYLDFIKMTENLENLCIFKFQNEDIVRNKFLIELTNRYDKYRYENENRF